MKGTAYVQIVKYTRTSALADWQATIVNNATFQDVYQEQFTNESVNVMRDAQDENVLMMVEIHTTFHPYAVDE